jgi:hypothetical protein
VQISEEDLTIIRQQIGREPQGIVKIAARAKNGVPLVLQMRSYVDNKPFPTLYWLCGKDLSKAIGTIETQGWVKSIEKRLETEEPLREAFLANQVAYSEKRQREMTEEDAQKIEKIGLTEVFSKYGIGGILQWDKVRCLHMQYAQHLVDGNVIGQLLDEEFELNKLLENPQLR